MKKKSIAIIIALVILVIVGVLAYIGTADLRQASTLRAEAQKLSEMDIEKDNVDMDIKTTGEYAVIEQTMKEYINKYSTTLKELEVILDDDKISELLTAENYKNDGPDFVETKKYITETRESFNEKMQTLIDMTSQEKMMEAIEEKNLSQEYVDLYKELMLGENMTEDLKEAVESLQESSEIINKILDIQDNIIDLLIENKGKWEVSDEGEIQFESQQLVNKYNEFLDSL